MNKNIAGKKIIGIFYKPLLWLALISYGLYLPASGLPKKPFMSIPYFDKMVHFVLFFVLCLLLFRPLKILKKKHLVLAPFISVFLGALFEITQHVISSSRNSNIYDFIANCMGITAALFFYLIFVSNRRWEKYL
jgi:VanZ family protein